MKAHLRYKTPFQVAVLLVMGLVLVLGSAVQAQIPPCDFKDGRINARPQRDCLAPVAIFMDSKDIRIVETSLHYRENALRATIQRDNNIPAAGNAVIWEGSLSTGTPVTLSRLTTGEYQLNSFYPNGPQYIAIWYSGANNLYHINPETNQPYDGAIPEVDPNAPNPYGGILGSLIHLGGSSAASTPVVTTGSSDAVATVDEDGIVVDSVSLGASTNIQNCRATTTRAVRIRTEPNTESRIIDVLPWRTTYTVTERVPGWYRLVYLDGQGWVSDTYLTTTGSCGG